MMASCSLLLLLLLQGWLVYLTKVEDQTNHVSSIPQRYDPIKPEGVYTSIKKDGLEVEDSCIASSLSHSRTHLICSRYILKSCMCIHHSGGEAWSKDIFLFSQGLSGL